MRGNWTETTLGQIARLVMGKTPPRGEKKYWTDELTHPFCTIADMEGKWVYPQREGVTAAAIQDGRARKVAAGSLMMSFKLTIGRVGFAGVDLYQNEAIVAIDVDTKMSTKDFLYLVLGSQDLTHGSGRAIKGATLNSASLAAIPLALPPLAEQTRIIDVMAAVDTYIAALQQQADDARAARNAVLHELLTAGGDGWTERNLGETLDISRGGSPRPIQEFITDREDGVNWVKIGDASNSRKYIYETKEKIKLAGVEKSRKVTSGDFILSNSMSFGRPYIMRCDGCIHDGWLLLGNVATHFDEDFLYNLLMSDHVQKQFNSLAAGSGVRNLNIEAVKGVVVSLPPLSAQQEIASIANTLDEFVWALEATVYDAKRMRQSVLAALLSGEHEIPETYDRLLGAA